VWSKSGAILTRPIDGRYYMYFGDVDIYYATSRDLMPLAPGPVDDPVMRPQPGTNRPIARPGPPPLITANGYILLIHNSARARPRRQS
jgi:hypothetical protein